MSEYLPKVLIVDDYPQNLLAMESLLENCELECHTAASGNEALSRVLDNEYALILLDVQMPEMDGFETAEIMRASNFAKSTPIIFITAHSTHRQEVFRGYETGAVDYILKPVEPEILLSKVAFFLSIDRQKKELEAQSVLLTTIFNSTPSMLFVIDEQAGIEKRNHQGSDTRVCGTHQWIEKIEEEIVTRLNSDDIAGCPVREKIASTFATGSPRYEEEVVLPVIHPETKIHYCLRVSTNLLHIDGARKVLLSATDITDIKDKEERLRRQQRAILLNNRIANSFLTAPKSQIFYHTIEAVLDPLESEFGYFGYLDVEGEMVLPSPENTIFRKQRLDEGQGVSLGAPAKEIWLQLSQTKQAVIVEDSSRTFAGLDHLDGILAVPIIHGEDLLGLFVVANKPSGYGAYDRELLEKAAAQTAPILHGLLEEERYNIKHQELERQYIQSQKLESVGLLAGGVAHDLNNLLSPILGYAEILASDLGFGDPRRESAEKIMSAGRRATDLIRQLLAFSRKQDLEFRSLHLNGLINDFSNLLRRTMREDIEFTLKQVDQLPAVKADVGQLEQVLMNLLVNAQDAMPEGGTLTIETSTMELDDQSAVQFESMNPGCYVVLSVTDTGCGMDAETCGRIFEPFFTTKGVDKGTGLGLSTVYGIIRQHSGDIQVESTPEKGTTFKVYLPVSEEQVDYSQPESEEGAVAPVDCSETILLVEDNLQVNELAGSILMRLGYKVLSAMNGEEALAILDTYQGEVHLLLTDVIMPDMNGKQLFDHVSRRFPEIKVIYMSGYTDDIISCHGIAGDGAAFVQKPFQAVDLTATVRNALDNEARPAM